MSYLGKDKKRCGCDSCGEKFDYDKCLNDETYFMYIPLEGQLIDLLMDQKLCECLTDRDVETFFRSNVISDVTFAGLYKDLVVKHGLTGNDMSVTWTTDGIPVFKSSTYSIWPLQCIINELPPHLRSQNVLLTGLWFGNKKPCMNTFLKPFVDECSKLEVHGFLFKNERVHRRVFNLVCSADSPARAIIKNCKQFNGCNGCNWCEHPGEPVIRASGPPVRYYPYRGAPVLRTARQQAEYALMAEEEDQPIKGVKGVSVIEGLPTFDCVKGFTGEYLHSVCQGVMRQLCNSWLDPVNHDESYYIGRRVEVLDGRLNTISPPSEISRAPRSLKECKFWKASEWRSFIFYGLAVLSGILPNTYLTHFFLFVCTSCLETRLTILQRRVLSAH